MIWWYWMLLGLVLLGAELMTPGGFYILFFGLAALIVGAMTGTGVIQAEWVQWLLFSGLAVVSLLIFRGPLTAWMQSHEHRSGPVDTMVGETALPLEDLAPGATGKAELRGTTWTAHNMDSIPLPKGRRSRVSRVEGLTLWIKAE